MLNYEKKPVQSKIYNKGYFLTGCLGSGFYKRTKGFVLDRRLKRCFEIADIKKQMKILDVGCGRGEVSLNCALNGSKVFAIDYSDAALKLTKKTILNLKKEYRKNVFILKMDAKNLAFKNNNFDRILLFDVIEHLYNWEIYELLENIKHTLKKDGKFIIHTSPNIWVYKYTYFLKRLYILIKKRKWLPSDPRSTHDKKMHVNEQSILTLKHLLKNFNSKIWVEFLTTPSERYKIVKLFEKSPIFRTPLKYFLCNDIFAVCTKKN
jgi:2-polyprenyl-3-methyl-5-hydroxy-6-metoxy-1,4-benzoquinol methylase